MTPQSSIRSSLDHERGIALVLSLFLMMALSVVASSLMFLSQTETYSSVNYKMMSQARYGAESGIQRTVNYLLNSYTPPTTTGADLLANYDTTKSPVTCLIGCPNVGSSVVLSANTAVASNYPVAAVQAAFLAGVPGTLPAGQTTVNYATSATLLSMQQVQVYGGGLQTIQTWQIISDGTITTSKTATVEVSATLETQKLPAQMYAAFGTNGGCGTLNFKGNTTKTGSYDSTALVGGNAVISDSGGNVGTNGNLTEAGGATINGTLSTPRVGVGSCSSGNVDALSSSGGASITGPVGCSGNLNCAVIQLPQAVNMPTPAAPNPMPPTTSYNGNNQTLVNGADVGDVTVDAGKTLTLCAAGQTCTITMNSLKLNGNGSIVVLGNVILNIGGKDSSGNWLTTPIDFTGGSVTNASLDPSKFQVQYAGTGNVKLNGGAQNAAMIYAPNADASFNGGGDFYGAVVASTVTDNGGANIYYDRHLTKDFFVVGNAMMSSFSWKKQ
jgi:hypothetical protein